jgi:hypothetical protein
LILKKPTPRGNVADPALLNTDPDPGFLKSGSGPISGFLMPKIKIFTVREKNPIFVINKCNSFIPGLRGE